MRAPNESPVPGVYAHRYSATCECEACTIEYRRRHGRTLVNQDPVLVIAKGRAKDHPQARAIDASGYVTREGEAWARRATPKVRGKAAKKRAKQLRHRQRAAGATVTLKQEG